MAETIETKKFEDSETWCLATATAKFLVPRLKRFKELSSERVVHPQLFYDNLDKVIKTFELIGKNDGAWIWTEEENKQVEEGLNLYKEMYFDLWW